MDHFDRHTANGPLSLESVGSHHNSDNTNQREIIMSDGSDSHSATPIKSEPDEHVRKVHRLGRACDPCSIRKTKCDQGKPCSPCHTLDIPCTFDRPKRRRGPPNRLAEAIKREHDARSHPSQAVAGQPTQDPGLQALTSAMDAESIAPIELIGALLDDYFTFKNPLLPFPHEPTFREKFRQRQDRTDNYFLALLASMIGVLVASYPRKPRQRLKKMRLEHLFPTAGEFVQRCHTVATQARGGGYLEKEHLCADDAATSFLLFIMCGSRYKLLQADMYCGEAHNIVRALFDEQQQSESEQDLVEEELTRRVFWSIFILVRSTMAYGASLTHVPVNTPSLKHQYPPLPREVDDERLTSARIESQPVDMPSRLAGFCALIRLCMVWDPLVALENHYNLDRATALPYQTEVLTNGLGRMKEIHAQLPDSLTTWPVPNSHSPSVATPSSTYSTHVARTSTSPMASSILDPLLRLETANEVQKANIEITYLSTRSYFVERYYSLLERQQTDHVHDIEACNWIRGERESIARELLHCTNSVSPIHLEANGGNIAFKIRQIITTLLPDQNDSQKHGMKDDVRLAGDSRLAKYLSKFVYILSALERGMNGPMTSPAAEMDQAEEEDLRKWASLREHQREYAKASGRIAT